jgi:hypothetical protein
MKWRTVALVDCFFQVVALIQIIQNLYSKTFYPGNLYLSVVS